MMKRVFIKIIVFFVLTCMVIISCSMNQANMLQQTNTGIFEISKGNSENIDKFGSVVKHINDWVDHGEIVGAELLVIENKEIIIHEVFGWMNKEDEIRMKKNTIFRIRSMTKPFIATAALMLSEEGKLNTADAVAMYLPSFANDLSKNITIEQLLTHTGGFSQPGFVKDYEQYASLREAVDDIGNRGPDYQPGTRYIYSDAGVAVLGAVIAEVSGMPLEDFIANRILRPLEMSDTFCNLSEDEDIKARISATYLKQGNDYIKYWDSSQPQTVSYFRASGGIYSTTIDYAKFLYMWMHHGQVGTHRFLSEQSVVDALTPGTINKQYGYLWETGDCFGHGGSDGTIAFAIPDKNLMVLYFTQSRNTHTAEVIKAMVTRAFAQDPLNQRERIDMDSERINEYVGQYRHPHVVLDIDTDGSSLLVKTLDSPDQTFYPVSEDFFVHELLDIQLSFTRNYIGAIMSVMIHQKGEIIELTKMNHLAN